MAKKKKKHGTAGATSGKMPDHKRAELLSCAKDIAEEICATENYELVHSECIYDGNSDILRIYIDKEGGIQMRDCTNLSYQIGDTLDVRFQSDLKYRLEVSSPGIERPVVKESDYEKFKGRKIALKTCEAINGKKKITGSIMGFAEGNAEILVDDIKTMIPFSIIKNAHLVADIGDY